VHFILTAVGARAVRWKYVTVNEAAMAEPPAFSPSDPDPPSSAEAAALLNEASRDPEWALFRWLTMVAGWRRGEACALRWTDLDLERGVITIERSHYRREEKRTKTRQRRNIAIDAETVEMLAAHLERCVADCTKLGTALAADAFVFSQAADHSVPLLPHSVSQRYRRLAERLGLRSTRLHALRHYSATELVAAGVDVRTVAGRLGHGSGGAITLKVYAAWSSEADRRAAGTIAGIVPRPDPTQRPARSAHERLANELRNAIAEGQLEPGRRAPYRVGTGGRAQHLGRDGEPSDGRTAGRGPHRRRSRPARCRPRQASARRRCWARVLTPLRPSAQQTPPKLVGGREPAAHTARVTYRPRRVGTGPNATRPASARPAAARITDPTRPGWADRSGRHGRSNDGVHGCTDRN
jgi:site-specific recombinase XerD